MTPEQSDLMSQAHDSLKAAEILHAAGFYGFAASRAYYAMFYAAEAMLLGKGLSLSKHSGVVAAFGEHFVKTRLVPREMHRCLVRSLEVRHAGDYGGGRSVTAEESAQQMANAGQFLEKAETFLGAS